MAENGNQEFLRETRQILTTMYHLFQFETHPQNIVLLYPIEWALSKNMKQFFPNRISIFILISMQNNVDFVNSAINNYHIDCFTIRNVQRRLIKEMKVDG